MQNTNPVFADMGLSLEMLQALTELGYTNATPIQQQAIPAILQGKDIIGQAATGTGKTAAFGIPVIERIPKSRSYAPFAIIICPTRELALQVSAEITRLAKQHKQLNVLPVYGGEGIQHQIKQLKAGVDIVVGTPGRLIDLINRKYLDLSEINMVVLDEADEMLNMGFREDIEELLSKTPENRQTILFSATMPKPIMHIAERFQKEPLLVSIKSENLTAKGIEQYCYDIPGKDRDRAIASLIESHQIQSAVVFCNTKARVEEVVQELQHQGIRAEGLHGDFSQSQRNAVLSRFKSGSVKVLVATDVAARGIDVNILEAVFNYDLPMDPEYYVHRIGRTGRAGRQGVSFSFVCGRNDLRRWKLIEQYAGIRVDKTPMPSEYDLFLLRREAFAKHLQEKVLSNPMEKQYDMIEFFLENGISQRQLIAALLHEKFPEIPNKGQARPTPHFEKGPFKKDFRDEKTGQRKSGKPGRPDRKRTDSRDAKKRGPEFKFFGDKKKPGKKRFTVN
jgi:ATP-dependent RNA helicase DeaD